MQCLSLCSSVISELGAVFLGLSLPVNIRITLMVLIAKRALKALGYLMFRGIENVWDCSILRRYIQKRGVILCCISSRCLVHYLRCKYWVYVVFLTSAFIIFLIVIYK